MQLINKKAADQPLCMLTNFQCPKSEEKKYFEKKIAVLE